MSDLRPAPAAGPSKLLLGAVGGLAILLVVGLAGLGYVLTNRPAAPPPSATPVIASTTATPATGAMTPTTGGIAPTVTRQPTATPFVSKEGTPSPTKAAAGTTPGTAPAAGTTPGTAPAAGTTPTTGSAAATTPTTATGATATPTPTATGEMPQTGASQIGLGAALGLVVLLLAARALRLRKRAQ